MSKKKGVVLADVTLAPKHAAFLVEYIKDFNPRRAAEAVGFQPEYGNALIVREDVLEVLTERLSQQLELNQIDAEWLLFEMIDNHRIARYQGNITASNTALNMVAKHKVIDAYAADKVKVTTDSDVADRLVAARRRLAGLGEDDEPVSFM